MSPDTAAAMVSGFLALLGILIALLKGRDKPGIGTSTPRAMVKALASGSAESVVVNVGSTLLALARTIADQDGRLEASENRIELLERHEVRYLARITELEEWGKWSTDGTPRKVPPWHNPPAP